MNRDLLNRNRPFFRRVLDSCPINNESFNILKVISVGFMGGTAVASPILFEEYRRVWSFDVFVFFFSSAIFMQQNQKEIKTYGPFTLVPATFLGLAAYSSARTPLKELVPWLPTALCLFILLTVYFFPKLRHLLRRDDGPQIAMEEGRRYEFHGTPVEPGFVQPAEDIGGRQQSPEVNRWLDYNTSHTGGRPASQHSEGLSTHESDIDLDDRQSVARIVAQRMLSPSRSAYQIGNLPRTASDTVIPPQRLAQVGPSSQWSQPRNYHQRSLSPASTAVEAPSSTSEESQRPLLR